MAEYGKPAPPSGPGPLNKLVLAISGIALALIALGFRQCQGQQEKTTSSAVDEKVKALEEKIKQLESREKPEEKPLTQAPIKPEVAAAPVPQQPPAPQAPALSANDVDEYKRNIDYQNGLIGIYRNSFQQYQALGSVQSMQETTRKSQRAEAMAKCLERYRSAAEPFYKASTACQAEASNTPTLF